MPKRVFITVAEVSGDQHAAALAKALWQLDPTLLIEGHGGSAMAAVGVVIHRETVNRATMFLRAAVRAVEVWKLLRWTRRYYQQYKTDLHICIDSSGMNLHFAKMARSCGVPVLYYISPQLWASREGRITQVRRYVNRVACILPFEEAYYRQRGVQATFVGHPLFDELPANRTQSPEPTIAFLPVGYALADGVGAAGRMSVIETKTSNQADRAHATRTSSPVIGLMPGSRRASRGSHFLADRRRARRHRGAGAETSSAQSARWRPIPPPRSPGPPPAPA